MENNTEQPKELPESRASVGYGSPPAATRFMKGVSGNPRGRPKGSTNLNTAFTRILRERVVINENGRRKTVTKLEAALKQLVNQAASGEIRAIRELLALASQAEEKPGLTGQHVSELSDFDREVIEGIVRRFQPTEKQSD